MNKKEFLQNIEKYCDIDGIEAIESVEFGECGNGCDVLIKYESGNGDMYSLSKLS